MGRTKTPPQINIKAGIIGKDGESVRVYGKLEDRLTPLNSRSKRTVEKFLAGLSIDKPGEEKKIAKVGATYGPIYIKIIASNKVSITQYTEKNGHFMPTPRIVLWQNEGEYYAVSYHNARTGIKREAIKFNTAGRPKKLYLYAQTSAVYLSNLWLSTSALNVRS